MSISGSVIILSSITVLIISLILSTVWTPLFTFFGISCTIGSVVTGLIITIIIHTFINRQENIVKLNENKLPFKDEAVIEFIKVCGERCRRKNIEDDITTRCLPVVFGRMVDAVLQQILDLALRDYVAHWLDGLAKNPSDICQTLKEDIWEAIRTLHIRLSNIDQTQLFACELTTKITAHFERLRLAQAAALRIGGPAVINVAPYVLNSNKEEQYLRGLSEMAIILLMPEQYSMNPLLRYLIREVLACAILHPTINMLCDPDFINQKIIAYIYHKKSIKNSKQPNIQTKSYEEFLHMIKDCDDLETLKHIRYNIVSHLHQAKMQLFQAKENQGDKNNTDVPRNLKSYIDELNHAKNECEKQLRLLGWKCSKVEENNATNKRMEVKQALPLISVLESNEGRLHLRLFLQQKCSTSGATPEGVGSPLQFLEYWITAEKMRQALRQHWHQLAQELYYTHIHPASSPIKVDKAIKKRMEAFLLGDQGPDIFYEVQNDIVKNILEEKYYPLFINSEYYQKMISAMEETASCDNVNVTDTNHSVDSSHDSDMTTTATKQNYTRHELSQLIERLNNKKQALQALKTSLKPESKVLLQLEKEVERLEGEHRQREAHLSKTEAWVEHLGHWRATVQSVELPDERELPQFVLVVYNSKNETDVETVSTGWVVLRKLSEFLELHKKLSPLDPAIRNLELPTYSSKFLFGKTVDKPSLEKAKVLIQQYLQFVLEDEILNQSEALYKFLSPSSDYLKHNLPSPKKTKFSLSTLFKSGSGGSASSIGSIISGGDESEDEELLLEEDGRIDGSRGVQDGIAEPLYALLGEVFDLRGVFRWLRRSLVTFVQITYGRTITRQVKETVDWTISETMLHFYAQVFIGAWWPHGELAPPTPERTSQQKTETRITARRLFLSNIPEVLSNLVGQQSARKGAIKVFDSLQETRLNKQLFYELLEVILYEIFPAELQPNNYIEKLFIK